MALEPVLQKGFLDYFNKVDADIFCIQETKLQEGQINLELEGYYDYWNYAEKRVILVQLYFLRKSLLEFHME